MGLLALGGALIGGIAGAAGRETSQTTSRALGPASALETTSGEITQEQLQQLQGLVGQGPGAAEVTAGLQSQQGLAERLRVLSEQGAFPEQQDILRSQDVAGQLFQAEQVGLQQSFQQQEQRTAQLAARLGRSVDDPILQARLAQQQTQAQERLAARQGAFGTQLALQQPFQRLSFAQQETGIRAGLASQALQNRQALASLGTQIRGQEQQFRLQSAPVTTTQRSGGGLGGFLTGALGGAAAGSALGRGLGSGGGFLGLGGGGGGTVADTFQMPEFGSQFGGGGRTMSLGGSTNFGTPSFGGGQVTPLGGAPSLDPNFAGVDPNLLIPNR